MAKTGKKGTIPGTNASYHDLPHLQEMPRKAAREAASPLRLAEDHGDPIQ